MTDTTTAPGTFIPAPPPLRPTARPAHSLEEYLPSGTDGGTAPRASRHASRRRRDPNPTGTMTLPEHLAELRKRLLLSALGIAAGTVVGWIYSEPVFSWLQKPFLATQRHSSALMSITFSGVASAFDMRLKIGFFIGILLSCPWWSYQFWAYIRPGLKKKERWASLAFVCASVPLFLLGAGLAWVFLPQAIAVLTGFAPSHTATLLSADTYLNFILRMTVAFGIAFLLPVVMVALTLAGIVETRTWARHWRGAVVVAFIFAAVATPTGDIGTLCAFGLPICAIYFLAIAVCWFAENAALLKIWISERSAALKARFARLRASRHARTPHARRRTADDPAATGRQGTNPRGKEESA